MASRNTGTWLTFLLVCFAVVGLAGVFASYAVPVPLQVALAQEATLDDVLAAARAPDAAAQLERLRPALGDSADAVLRGPDPIEQRVAHERAMLRDVQERTSDAVGRRVRLLIGVVTVTAGLFGAGIMALSRH